MNEYGEVVALVFLPNGSQDYKAIPLHAIKNNAFMLMQQKVKVIFTDNCCMDREFLLQVFPHLQVIKLNSL
jgi:hypothetical protein